MRLSGIKCLVGAALCLAGCSVKSDRTECPCLVNLSLKGGAEALASIYVMEEDRVELAMEGVPVGRELSLPVKRGSDIRVFSCSGIHSCLFEEDEAYLPCSGLEMDELYAGSVRLVSDGENVSAGIKLHKQFAIVGVTLTGSDSKDYPYNLAIEGGYTGINLSDMSPREGVYSVELLPFIGEYRRICLPRQGEAPLTLSFHVRDSLQAGSLRGADPVNLGELIKSCGYDWSKEDLDDIMVEINYENTKHTVTVVPWTTITVDEKEF